MRAALFLFPFAFFSPQEPADPTLDQVIERMEKAAAAARGSAFVLDTQKGPRFEPGLQRAEITIAKDGSVRINEPPDADRRQPSFWGRATSMVLADDAVYVSVDELPAFTSPSRQSGIRKSTQRFSKDDCDRVDPFSEKWAGSSYTWFWHAYFYALSPARAFKFERNLKLVGRRKIGDTECFLLQSDRPLDYGWSYESNGQKIESGTTGQRRRFFVSVSDYRLKRFDDIRRSPGDWVSPPVTSLFETYDGGIPTRAHVGYNNNLSGWKVRPTEAKDARRGLDVALVPDPADLYATKVRVGDLADRLQKSPDDPDVLFSSAIYESNTRMSQAQDLKPFIAKLEKTIEKSWSPTPVRNLLALLTDANDKTKLAPLMERIEKDPPMGAKTAPQVIRALLCIGEYDKAAAILDAAKDLEMTGLWWARTELLLRKGDFQGAIADYAKWPAETVDAASMGSTYRTFELQRLVKKLQQLDPKFASEAFLAALDAAIAADPKNPRLHLARLTMLREGGDLAKISAAAGAALAACDDAWVTWQACATISSMVGGRSEVKIDPEKLQASLESMLKALEPNRGRPCVSATIGSLLLKAGRKDEAMAEFQKELDVLEKSGPKHASNAMWVTEALKDLKENALLERACRIHLAEYRQGGQTFRAYEWTHATSPLATLFKLYSESGRLSEVYGAMKGMTLQRGLGAIWDMRLNIPVPDIGAAMKAGALEDKDPAGIRWFAMLVLQTEEAQVAGMLGLDPIEWLDRARAVDPEDVGILQSLAEAQAKKGEPDAALRTVVEIRAALKAGTKIDGAWSPVELTLFAADQHLKNKDPKSAKAELLTLNYDRSEYPPWTAWQLADALEEVGEFDKAAVAITRSEEFGHRPAYRLLLHYMKKRDWVEAMKFANRAIDTGYTLYLMKPGTSRYPDMELMKRYSADRQEIPRSLRDDIRAKAGARFFIDRLLATKLPAMTAEETSRAEKALAALDTGNVPEREGALKEFRALGPKSAPVLIKMLKDEESIWRTAALGLLNEWAEPR